MNTDLPRAFLERVALQLGPELPVFTDIMKEPSIRGIRMNPLRPDSDMTSLHIGNRISWCRDGWELASESPAGSTIAHETGAFYLQEPSAMIPAVVMDARPGETILDLCAAPGGKSTQIGTSMQGKGLLVCNEPVPKRAAILSRNIERMGIANAIVTSAWPEHLAVKWPEGFDGVMADVPCSGEGMFRRDPETRYEWSQEKAEGCVPRQQKILEAAAKLVRPGGRLIYSTCTFNPAENEDQIRWFLDTHDEFESESFQLPGVNGREGFFTCWPHRIRGEGQFVALLRKKGNGERRFADGIEDFRIPREKKTIWKESGLTMPEPNAIIGQNLVRISEIPDLKGIRVLRLGVDVAEIRGKNLIPAHAAVLAGLCGDMPTVELQEEDALRYMSGETLEIPACGWTVLTYRGMNLGWGKGSEGRIKNHYPKGLRNGRLIG